VIVANRIYLDNNATTAIAPEVLEAMIAELKSGPSNPSSIHAFGQEARNRLTKARRTIASFFNVRSSEVIFTSGGTEAINLVLRGMEEGLKGGHIISTDVEHSAVYTTLQEFQRRGIQVTFLSVGLHGAAALDAVIAAIQPNTRLMTLMAVNNETGVKTDIQAIASLAEERGIAFVVDGVALMGKEPFTIPEGVSAMCFSGHKFHAPKGVGIAVIRKKLKLAPTLTGGGQEYERRGGTENLAGIIAISAAVQLLETDFPQTVQRMLELRLRLENQLCSLPDVCVNGGGPRVSNTSNLAFCGVEGESLLIALDLAGIAASHGSACSSGSLEPSRILLNMGISKKMAGSSLRFSLSRYTTLSEIDEASNIISDIIKRLRG